MDIRSLNQVLAIRKYGSFARAAEALGVSQPNLSKSVARLEDQLKLKIFDRTAKGSALTPVGELIVERADAVISETRDLARDASLLAGGETGVVRIGCTTGLQSTLLAPLLGRIVGTHPDLKVHAEAASGGRLIPLLDSRDLDVVFTGSAPDRDAYVAETILEAPSIFAASPWHPLANERNISTARLAQFKCGGSHSPGSSNARLLGFESEFLGMYTASNYEILMPLVLRGDMALLMPSFVAQPYLEAGSLVALDTQWRHMQKYLFVTTRGASYSPIVRQIREHAHAIGAQLRDSWRNLASRFADA